MRGTWPPGGAIEASEADPLAQVVFNIHGGLVHRDLFWAIGGFDPWFSHAELVDWFRRLLRALPHPDAFDILDAVTYVCRKRRGSHSSDRARVEPQRVAALQRYALAEGVPPADLDAPMINVETGCPEYKRVESAPDVSRRRVPRPSYQRAHDAHSGTRARRRPAFAHVVEPIAPLGRGGAAPVVVEQVQYLRREVTHGVGDEVAVDDAAAGLTLRRADVGVVEMCADDGSVTVQLERQVLQLELGLIDPSHPLVEDPGGLQAHPLAVGQDDDQRFGVAPVLPDLGGQLRA